MTTEELEVASEAIDRLPDRRPASLYDVAVQYSILDWYQTVVSGELDFELDPEHLAFMTPMAKDGLYDEAEDNALVVYVDCSEPENPGFRDEEPVAFESVDESGRFRLGHSYPANKTSAMTDYSITTHKEATEHHLAGQRDDAWGTNNIKDRFTEWAHSDAADRVLEREGTEDKEILQALRIIGDNPERIDEMVERGDVGLDPEDEETEHEVFVTVRIKLPGDDEYSWPGEIPILNEVMVEQKAERFENISVENAGGEGVGYVRNEEERVTGGSAGLLGMYAKKQREHFSDLSPDGSEAWRNRPLTRENAAAIATANSLFEEFYEGLGNSRRLYVLPYLGVHPDMIEDDDLNSFVSEVFGRLREREDTSFQEAIGDVFFDREVEGEEIDSFFEGGTTGPNYEQVEIATVFLVTGNPDRVFFEELRTDMYRPLEIDRSHGDVLQSPVFSDGIFAKLRDRSDSPLLRPGANRRNMALFGGYFEWTTEPTRTSEEAQDTPKAGDIDDIRARRLRQFLQGETIPLRTLLEEYLHLLVQRQQELFGEESDTEVPTRQVAEQYAQLRALEGIGVLGAGRRRLVAGTDEQTTTETTTFATVTEQMQDHEDRESRLEDFIESHEVLSNSKPSQAVFLLGGLVGRVSAYQRQPEKNVSSTLVRRYPIDYLTKQSIKEVTNEVIQMNNTYIEADDLPSTYNARYANRLPDLMLESDPGSWSLTQNELQWLYALGITYGLNDTQIDTEE